MTEKCAVDRSCVATRESTAESVGVTSWRLRDTRLTWLHREPNLEDEAVHLLNCSVPAVSNLIVGQRCVTSVCAFSHTFLIYTDGPTGGQHAHAPTTIRTHIYFNLLPV